MNTCADIIARLRELAVPERKAGMARFGIDITRALGVTLPELRQLAKRIGTNHALAGELWESGLHEARILAGMVDDPAQVTPAQMEAWAQTFDSWDVTDQCVNNLFRKTPRAHDMAAKWTQAEAEFVKRAGFALIAALAVHDRHADDQAFVAFFPLIAQAAGDRRNFVKKAVNWALRQIGKRNMALNHEAIRLAETLRQQPHASAKWIAADALRELTNPKILARIHQKNSSRNHPNCA